MNTLCGLYSVTLNGKNIDEIYVIGHSVAEVDLPYFRYVENCTHQADWTVYYFNVDEKYRNKRIWKIYVGRISNRYSRWRYIGLRKIAERYIE